MLDLPDLTNPYLQTLQNQSYKKARKKNAGRYVNNLERVIPDELIPFATQFAAAMDRYKTLNRRPFPAWSEALWVLTQLGWQHGVPAIETGHPQEECLEGDRQAEQPPPSLRVG